MKKKTLLNLFFVVVSAYCFSQTSFNSKGFNVTKADLELNTFYKDSTAQALVIYEAGESYIDKKSFNVKTKIKRKIKILSKEGFKYATISIYLYNNKDKKETVSKISATSYSIENGNIITSKIEKNRVYEKKHNDKYTIVKFALPQVKEGAIITYSYELNSPFIYKYKSWKFQSDIPKLYSEYKTSIPAIYEYNIKLVGNLKLDTNESNLKKECIDGPFGSSAGCTLTTYIMKDIPPFIEEDFMTAKDNYLARIDYELKAIKHFDGTVNNITKTWKTVDKELKIDNDLGGQLNKGSLVKNLIPLSIKEISNQLIKAKSIYNFVQNNYTWNSNFNIFHEISIKELIKSKTGNVSEINLLLFNLLKKNNINVKPVLLSTRKNGFPTKIYPVISDFNYLIVQTEIEGVKYLLDATDPYLAFGQIPYRCLNGEGRLLDFKNGSEWIPIKASKASIVSLRANLNLKGFSITGDVKSKTTGYESLKLRKEYFSNNVTYLKYANDKYPNLNFTNYNVNVKDKTNTDFNENYKITFEPDQVGDKIYIDPFLIKFFTENPFKLQERTYPIDFGYPRLLSYNLQLKIDERYKIEQLPENIAIQLPNNTGRLRLNIIKKENTVFISFKIELKKSIYTVSNYPYLKEFFSKTISAQNDSMIVVAKK